MKQIDAIPYIRCNRPSVPALLVVIALLFVNGCTSQETSGRTVRLSIATGGTGGHIFPSLSLADFLKRKHEVEIVTDKRGLRYVPHGEEINIRTINSDTVFGKNIFKACQGVYIFFFLFKWSFYIGSRFFLFLHKI